MHPLRTERTRKLILTGALAVATIASGAFSMAYFTDTESDDSTFDTGTIILDAAKVDALNLTTSDMVPGDSITSAVVVENDGTDELRYDLDSAAADTVSPNGEGLFTELEIAVSGADVDTTPDGDSCDDFDGTPIQTQEVLGATNSLAANRVLAANASETLCVRVVLPSDTGNDMQDASSVTTFTFAAEQTANN
jgi:predicted ribosomally synthesized peptide with SipW-like signal peptide